MSEEQIEFRFAGIQTMAKNLTALQPGEKTTGFNFEVKVETRVQAEAGNIIIVVIIKILNDNKESILANYEVWCIFEVIDFDKKILINDLGLHVIPDILQNTFLPVAISTVRGIIFSDLVGTYLQNAIMPVIYMTSFKPEVAYTERP